MEAFDIVLIARIAAFYPYLRVVMKLMMLCNEFYAQLPKHVRRLHLMWDDDIHGNSLPMDAIMDSSLRPCAYLRRFIALEEMEVDVAADVRPNERLDYYSQAFFEAGVIRAIGDLMESGSFARLRSLTVYLGYSLQSGFNDELEMYKELVAEHETENDEESICNLRSESYESWVHTLTLHLLRALDRGSLPCLRDLEIIADVKDEYEDLVGVYFSSSDTWPRLTNGQGLTWWEQRLIGALNRQIRDQPPPDHWAQFSN